jgi:hypothetical protein
MQRRGFLGALAALAVAGKAAPEMARRMVASRPAQSGGLLDCVVSTPMHGIRGDTTTLWLKMQGQLDAAYRTVPAEYEWFGQPRGR